MCVYLLAGELPGPGPLELPAQQRQLGRTALHEAADLQLCRQVPHHPRLLKQQISINSQKIFLFSELHVSASAATTVNIFMEGR